MLTMFGAVFVVSDAVALKDGEGLAAVVAVETLAFGDGDGCAGGFFCVASKHGQEAPLDPSAEARCTGDGEKV